METLIKKDLKISALIGFSAGILALPTLHNIGVVLNAKIIVLAVASLSILAPLGYWLASWLNRWIPVALQFMKFAIVGGLNTLLDLGILNLEIFIFGVAAGLSYSIFKSVSFLIAVVSSYLWNKYWTFQSHKKTSGGEVVRFFFVNLVGFAINVGAASIVVNFIGAPAGITPSLWANIGAVSAIAVSLIWNFIGMKFIVFKQ